MSGTGAGGAGGRRGRRPDPGGPLPRAACTAPLTRPARRPARAPAGGNIDYAFQWIVDNGGIATEDEYSYRAVDEQCELEKRDADKVVTIDRYHDVPSGSEAELRKAVSQQPVSVGIDASCMDFHLYSEGVFTNHCGESLDHGVLAVGYGTDAPAEAAPGKKPLSYWIVKNSWAAGWGEDGYIRMQVG